MDCLQPKGISNPKTGQSMRVRCGKCLPCKKARAGSWTIRLSEELKKSRDNWFVTLTISDENLTWGYDKPTLSKWDVQRFMRYLRRNNAGQKMRYFAVGEYGETTKRPHYHILLFNTNLSNHKLMAYISDQSWKKGYVHVGEVTEASIRYVAGYMEKGLYSTDVDESIQREFNLMSKGIGQSYINSHKEYHEKTKKFDYHLGGGKFAPLPRYFRERIFNESERNLYAETIAVKMVGQSPADEEKKLNGNLSRLRAMKSLKNKRK